MSVKRILFIDHTAAFSGAQLSLLHLIESLDRSRFTPVVLLFSDGPLAAKLRSTAETHVLPLDPAVIHTRKDSLGVSSALKLATMLRVARFTRHVAKFIRQHQIDVVHTNSLKADIIGGLAGRLAGRPVVWHIRDRISPDYLPRAAVSTIRLLARVMPTHIVGVSQAVLNTVGARYRPGNGSNSTVVLDGIKVFDFVPTPTLDEIAIGLIGRISPWKGQDIFIRAAAIVKKRFPQAKFRIIGAALFGENGYERKLHALCAELGLQDVVEFTGFRHNVREDIAKLSMVVHASTLGEPFGQVIIEGMAAGKPVIATRGGGVPEIVEDGVSGLLVPMGDECKMAEAICFLLDHPDRAQELALNGRARVEKVFRIERVARDMEDVFTRVVNGRSRQ